jgi:hypothetical protein
MPTFDLPEQGPLLAVAQDVFFRYVAIVQREHVTLLTSNPKGIQAAHVPHNLPKTRGHFCVYVSAVGGWTLGVFAPSEVDPEESVIPNQGTISLVSGNCFEATQSCTHRYKVPPEYRILGIREERFWWAILTDHGPYRISSDLLPSFAGYPAGVSAVPWAWEKEAVEPLLKRLREAFRSRISLIPHGSRTEHWVWTQESEGSPLRLHKFDWTRGTFEEIQMGAWASKISGEELVDVHPYLPIAHTQAADGRGHLIIPFVVGNLKTVRTVPKGFSWCWTRLGAAVEPAILQKPHNIFEDAWGRVGVVSDEGATVHP